MYVYCTCVFCVFCVYIVIRVFCIYCIFCIKCILCFVYIVFCIFCMYCIFCIYCILCILYILYNYANNDHRNPCLLFFFILSILQSKRSWVYYSRTSTILPEFERRDESKSNLSCVEMCLCGAEMLESILEDAWKGCIIV